MNYRIIHILFLFLFSLGAFAQQYNGAFHIEQKAFREQNDSLFISFNLRIDSRAVPSCSSMVFEPELRDDNNHLLVFPYIQVNGEERARLNSRWFALCSKKWLAAYQLPYMQIDVSKYSGEELNYSFSVPYESWMDHSRLVLKQEIIGCAGEMNLYTYTLGNQITLAPRAPYDVRPLISMVVPGDEKKSRSRQGSAFLDFQVGRSNILPDFRRNPVELGKINDALTDVMGDMDSQITGLFIEGYASPEGRYSSNERLAGERAAALKEYIRVRYMFPEAIFKVTSIAEDWDGLRSLVESSSLPAKDQILAVIDSNDDYDRKEQRLKGIAGYSTLLRDFFPELRRVEYQINYSVRNYTNAEARDLMKSSPENLSQAELYRVALEYGEGSTEYKRILMETIPRYFESDPVALNNAAALMLKNGEVNTALRLLEKAGEIPSVWNNLGVAYMLNGELEKAEELLNQASITGIQEAEHNLEELKKKREDEAKQQLRSN